MPTMFKTKRTLENSTVPSKLDIVKYTKFCEYYFGSAEFIEGTDVQDVSRNPTLCQVHAQGIIVVMIMT